jgi:hypothetical protein
MAPVSRSLALVSLLVLGASTAWCASAWAHPAVELTIDPPAAVEIPSTAVRSAAPAPPAIPWPGLFAVAAAIIVVRVPRRALALATVLILGLFAFESGVHSVHHLNNPQSRAACSVAAATVHVAGTPVDGMLPEPVVLPSQEWLVLQQPPNFEALSLAVHQGRAPPLAA